MIKNRVAALVFRVCAFVICIIGLLVNLGVFDREFSGIALLYYTLQSNIVVIIFFGVLAVKTAIDLWKDGRWGSASYFPRTSGAVLLCILLTLIVFWALLARQMTADYLLSYKNFGVHLINPLLMLADYIMFTEIGKMKKCDPFLYTLFPLFYFVQATILGLAGINYNHTAEPGVWHFPYFFIDYYETGVGWVLLYVIGISAAYIGLAFLFGFIQKKIVNRNSKGTQEKEL